MSLSQTAPEHVAPHDQRPLKRLRPAITSTDRFSQVAFLSCSILALGFLALIIIFIFSQAAGAFIDAPGHIKLTIKSFIFGQEWYPAYDPPDFGIWPLIVASVLVTMLAMSVAGPLGIGLAIYLNSVASPWLREVIKPAVELVAAIPSVVLGFVGMVVLAPLMQRLLDIPTGLNLLNAGIMLGFMATPTVASLSEDALAVVPRDMIEGSYALGATKWETLWKVRVRAALGGLSTALILGLGRAMGETILVLMVAGGAAQIPHSLFDPVRPLTATLAAEQGEAAVGSQHYHALFAIGAVLFLVTLAFNMLAIHIRRRYRLPGSAG